jgi:hypothetical protein
MIFQQYNQRRHLFTILFIALSLAFFLLPVSIIVAGDSTLDDEQFFTLSNGVNLRSFGGQEVRKLLSRMPGSGITFTTRQEKQYCRLKQNSKLQWILTNLETGDIISRSANAEEVFFGASVSKIFVAAALLDKQDGKISKEQLVLMTRMIVRSDNPSWRELQRQAGSDGSDDSGRQAVQAFIGKMGYENLFGFQGWMTLPDGGKLHGNELNSLAVAKFLYDTYHKHYPGAEVLWTIMHATRTGSNKINKYAPRSTYVAGKTGTYHGINESKTTIKLPVIKARNHATVFSFNETQYCLVILCNTGKDEDVAVLGGGLMREYLGVKKAVRCPDGKVM